MPLIKIPLYFCLIILALFLVSRQSCEEKAKKFRNIYKFYDHQAKINIFVILYSYRLLKFGHSRWKFVSKFNDINVPLKFI